MVEIFNAYHPTDHTLNRGRDFKSTTCISKMLLESMRAFFGFMKAIQALYIIPE